MDGDLGAALGEVHENARAVLDFWLGLTAKQRFAKDAELDRQIGERFGPLRAQVRAMEVAGWRDDPDTLLAAIILLDQFSHNIGRDTPVSFEADDLAAGLTLYAIERGWEGRYSAERRIFLYMPLMHAEDMPMQDMSVARFKALGLPDNLRFAIDHRDVIARYGRFPSRNAALARRSTPDGEAYLSRPDAGW